MTARIFKPAKTAMQSGKARTMRWVLEYEPEAARQVEPLMGWTSSSDMHQQIKLTFPSKDDAVAYAERNDIAYLVLEPKTAKRQGKAYSDNFRFGRIGQWTH